MPLVPFSPDDPPEARLALEQPEAISSRIVFLIKRYLHPLLVELERRREKLVRLDISFVYDSSESVELEVRPAEPTLDEAQLLELIRLRLESLEFEAGVVEVDLCAHTSRARQRQLRMFVADKKRDLEEANRALAKLRAEMGEEAVVRARLLDGHLPEARFGWEPLDRLEPADPDEVESRPLIRRICRRPELLHGTDPTADGDIDLAGPFVISGGWWAGGAERHYHFARDDGGVVWVYWDARRKRWFRQGGV